MSKGKPAVELTPEQKVARSAEREAKKKADFVRIAGKRMDNAIKMIRLLEPLGNRNSYSYSVAQAQALANGLYDVIENVMKKFGAVDADEAPPASFAAVLASADADADAEEKEPENTTAEEKEEALVS